MKISRRFNPLCWSKRTIIIIALVFYAIAIPFYLYFGFSAAATAEDGKISIPAVEISSGIEKIEQSGKLLETPDVHVGSFSKDDSKVFLFAHSTSAFKNLKNVNLEDEVNYNGETFIVTKIITLPVEKVDMEEILKPAEEKTLVLMTCAGEEIDGKFTHRLLVTAVPE